MLWVSYTSGTNGTTVVGSCILGSDDGTYSCKLPVLLWYGAVDLTYSIVWSIMYNYLLNVIVSVIYNVLFSCMYIIFQPDQEISQA